MTPYKDFWLRIERRGDEFWVSSRSTDAGERSAPLKLPPEIANLSLSSLLDAERGTSRSGPTRQVRHEGEVEAPPPDVVGKELFRALFSETINNAFYQNWGDGHEGGVRIRLQTDLGDEALARLASLPWELMVNEGMPALGRYKSTPIVRYLDVAKSFQTYPFERPLRVLIVVANPKTTDPLDLTKEKESIKQNLAHLSDVEVTVLEKATREALFDKLDTGDYHVLHYMGHGGVEENGRGFLFLEDEEGNAEPLSSKMLGDTLSENRSVRLVFLNACDTAKTSQQEGLDPFAGVASALVAAGVPAVVAMQEPVTDSAALVFAEKFYAQIAHGDPVDAAVTVGRKAIYQANETSLEWATPVLFMRAKDGRLFDFEGDGSSVASAAEEGPAEASAGIPTTVAGAASLRSGTPISARNPSDPSETSPAWKKYAVAGGIGLLAVLATVYFVNRNADVGVGDEVSALMSTIAYDENDEPYLRDVAQRMVADRDEMEQAGFTRTSESVLFASAGQLQQRSVAVEEGFAYVVRAYGDEGCELLDLAVLDGQGEFLGGNDGTHPTVRLSGVPRTDAYEAEMVVDGCSDGGGFIGLGIYRQPADSQPVEASEESPLALVQFGLSERSTYEEGTRPGGQDGEISMRYFETTQGGDDLLIYTISLHNPTEDDVFVTEIIHHRLHDNGEAGGGDHPSGRLAPGDIYVQNITFPCEYDDPPIAAAEALADPLRISAGDAFNVELQVRYTIEDYPTAILAPIEMRLGIVTSDGGVVNTPVFVVDAPSCAG